MKIVKINLLWCLLAALIAVYPADGFAAAKNIRAAGGENTGELSGKLRRIEQDMEDIDQKINRTDVESKKYMQLKQERDRLSLEFIHEAQLFFFDGKNKKNENRAERIRRVMKNEITVLEDVLGKEKSFPYFKYLDKVDLLIQGIRAGKIKYPEKLPKKDGILLRDIQKMQKDALMAIQKEQMRSRR